MPDTNTPVDDVRAQLQTLRRALHRSELRLADARTDRDRQQAEQVVEQLSLEAKRLRDELLYTHGLRTDRFGNEIVRW
ncbi:hypothetical protein [Sediminivirga luteola]|uniref:Uncharacterized protein n=1 Tax=Sediminivirga luteola TaxID=1774748 RepID=A0A8J2XJW5_9MICO|nr:hypothetical protein [Sediminivirga luteola]GGA09651.1 hypothetical protein GCM10011333_10490 [Sediminivirga luteola]